MNALAERRVSTRHCRRPRRRVLAREGVGLPKSRPATPCERTQAGSWPRSAARSCRAHRSTSSSTSGRDHAGVGRLVFTLATGSPLATTILSQDFNAASPRELPGGLGPFTPVAATPLRGRRPPPRCGTEPPRSATRRSMPTRMTEASTPHGGSVCSVRRSPCRKRRLRDDRVRRLLRHRRRSQSLVGRDRIRRRGAPCA